MSTRVLLSPGADEARQRLPLALRHRINEAIRRIAANPDWGAPGTPDGGPVPLRLLNPGRPVPENSGLIADLSVRDSGLVYAIVYRIREKGAEIWIEDITSVMIG